MMSLALLINGKLAALVTKIQLQCVNRIKQNKDMKRELEGTSSSLELHSFSITRILTKTKKKKGKTIE